jgi:hypothetical protein
MISLHHVDRRLRSTTGVAKLGQFADVHDSFAELLRTMDRQTLIEWIGAAAGLTLSEVRSIHERSTTISALGFIRSARKGLADVVFTLLGADDRIVMVLILEMQLTMDWSKRWDWPMLATTFAAEVRRTARVVVFTPDPVRRGQIRRLLLPKIEPRPILIEPDQIPLICDVERARAQPRETIFAALYHVRERHEPVEVRVAGIRAAIIGLRTLDRHEKLRYGDLMQSFTPDQIMQRVLENLKASGEWEEDGPDEPVLYRDSYAFVSGRREGRVEAQQEGAAAERHTLRKLLVNILETRGIALTSATRVRIERCDDAAVLMEWCTRASVHTGASEELFDA